MKMRQKYIIIYNILYIHIYINIIYLLYRERDQNPFSSMIKALGSIQ